VDRELGNIGFDHDVKIPGIIEGIWIDDTSDAFGSFMGLFTCVFS
jgi:hypothetical protein